MTCPHSDLRDLGYVNGERRAVRWVLLCRKCGAYIERVVTERPLKDAVVLGKLV